MVDRSLEYSSSSSCLSPIHEMSYNDRDNTSSKYSSLKEKQNGPESQILSTELNNHQPQSQHRNVAQSRRDLHHEDDCQCRYCSCMSDPTLHRGHANMLCESKKLYAEDACSFRHERQICDSPTPHKGSRRLSEGVDRSEYHRKIKHPSESLGGRNIFMFQGGKHSRRCSRELALSPYDSSNHARKLFCSPFESDNHYSRELFCSPFESDNHARKPSDSDNRSREYRMTPGEVAGLGEAHKPQSDLDALQPSRKCNPACRDRDYVDSLRKCFFVPNHQYLGTESRLHQNYPDHPSNISEYEQGNVHHLMKPYSPRYTHNTADLAREETCCQHEDRSHQMRRSHHIREAESFSGSEITPDNDTHATCSEKFRYRHDFNMLNTSGHNLNLRQVYERKDEQKGGDDCMLGNRTGINQQRGTKRRHVLDRPSEKVIEVEYTGEIHGDLGHVCNDGQASASYKRPLKRTTDNGGAMQELDKQSKENDARSNSNSSQELEPEDHTDEMEKHATKIIKQVSTISKEMESESSNRIGIRVDNTKLRDLGDSHVLDDLCTKLYRHCKKKKLNENKTSPESFRGREKKNSRNSDQNAPLDLLCGPISEYRMFLRDDREPADHVVSQCSDGEPVEGVICQSSDGDPKNKAEGCVDVKLADDVVDRYSDEEPTDDAEGCIDGKPANDVEECVDVEPADEVIGRGPDEPEDDVEGCVDVKPADDVVDRHSDEEPTDDAEGCIDGKPANDVEEGVDVEPADEVIGRGPDEPEDDVEGCVDVKPADDVVDRYSDEEPTDDAEGCIDGKPANDVEECVDVEPADEVIGRGPDEPEDDVEGCVDVKPADDVVDRYSDEARMLSLDFLCGPISEFRMFLRDDREPADRVVGQCSDGEPVDGVICQSSDGEPKNKAEECVDVEPADEVIGRGPDEPEDDVEGCVDGEPTDDVVDLCSVEKPADDATDPPASCVRPDSIQSGSWPYMTKLRRHARHKSVKDGQKELLSSRDYGKRRQGGRPVMKSLNRGCAVNEQNTTLTLRSRIQPVTLASVLRGFGRWDESLRQKPRKTSTFQINFTGGKQEEKPSTVTSDDCAREGKLGIIVWGKVSQRWWPGMIIPGDVIGTESVSPGSSWIFWFGDHKVSHIKNENTDSFMQGYPSRYNDNLLQEDYKQGVHEAIQECAVRSKCMHGGVLHQPLLDWADSTLSGGVSAIFPNTDARPLPIYKSLSNILEELRRRKAGDNEDTPPKGTKDLHKLGRDQDHVSREHQRNASERAESRTSQSEAMVTVGDAAREDDIGRLVWAKFTKQRWWPAIVVPGDRAGFQTDFGKAWVFWFGDNKVSQILIENMVSFIPGFPNKYEIRQSKQYKAGILEAILECASRSKLLPLDSTQDALLSWADKGFCDPASNKSPSSIAFAPAKDNLLSKFVEARLRDIKYEKSGKPEGSQIGNEKRLSEAVLHKVEAGQAKIEDVCISCKNEEQKVVCQHPFFKGGLCHDCKHELCEWVFAVGADGLYVYCTICSDWGETFICSSPECNRVYCFACIEGLGGHEAIDQIHALDDWMCYLCQKQSHQNLLEVKQNWRENLIKIFHDNEAIMLERENLSYFNIVPRKRVRVLSLFDGIGTGKYVLDLLGMDVEVYYASEIDEAAIMVANANLQSTVVQLGDVRNITEEKLKEICPIDLIIGGSPCNDLAMVNAARKGFEGSGTLVFEFWRILKEVQRLALNRHVFWMFENVVFMKTEYKTIINRFLGKPSIWDAKYFTPQNRARHFWGNIPGMHSKARSCQPDHPVLLDDLLEPNMNRQATVDRLRTITTRGNSLLQGVGEDILPVSMDGKDDRIWIGEIERVFGFSTHYTDIGNLSVQKRQGLLGKSWSVPVVRHILSPLKTFFASCTDQPKPK